MNPGIDQYLIDGCGRCDLYKTPDCKVNSWRPELIELRAIVLNSDLTETFKWSQPCYTFNDKNVLIVTAFKNYACVSFFKGALLNDSHGILVTPGKSSQAARQLRFTSIEQIFEAKSHIETFIKEAIEIEKAGRKIGFKKNLESIPKELEEAFEEDSVFESAFYSLTLGRQRGYILHFSQPKQSKTRKSRIEKCIAKILNGEGLNDNYKSKRKS